jgi:hypothetical protein
MLTMDPTEMQQHRIENPELEFLSRFPDARNAVIYEFASESEAEAAKVTLLAATLSAGQRARVTRVPWKERQRVLAIATF